MHFQMIDVDIEKIRSQLADELSRPVTDVEVSIWLRRSGCIRFNDIWLADSSNFRESHSNFREIPTLEPRGGAAEAI